MNIDETMVFQSLMLYARAWSVVAEDPVSGQFFHTELIWATAAATSATEGDGGLQGTAWPQGTARAVGIIHRINDSLFCAESNFNVKSVSTSHL